MFAKLIIKNSDIFVKSHSMKIFDINFIIYFS